MANDEVRDIPICFKPTEEDIKILEWLKKKLGANTTGVIRQSIRALRDKEKGPTR
jgi:macrodomain Ter protein organizer (MatP/YcbG family)